MRLLDLYYYRLYYAYRKKRKKIGANSLAGIAFVFELELLFLPLTLLFAFNAHLICMSGRAAVAIGSAIPALIYLSRYYRCNTIDKLNSKFKGHKILVPDWVIRYIIPFATIPWAFYVGPRLLDFVIRLFIRPVN